MEETYLNPYWNICLLALAWGFTLSTSTLLTAIGPLSAIEIGASDTFAAFTIGVFLIGAALSSVPSGWLFRNYGRFIGFSVGCVCQFIGAAFGSFAMYKSSLPSLYVGCLFIGLGQGLGQFYRFAAVEVTPPKLQQRAITYVLSGGILAAFVGPTLATFSYRILPVQYEASYMIIAAIAMLNQGVLFLTHLPPSPNKMMPIEVTKYKQLRSDDGPSSLEEKLFIQEACEAEACESVTPSKQARYTGRKMSEIISQPLFIISCATATLAHTIMIMLMSNASVEMANNDYSFQATAFMMELHFFSMFSPGFFTGILIKKKGSFFASIVGAALFGLGTLVLAVDHKMWNFFVGMCLVGIAWNFSYSAGTVMLTKTYRPDEAQEVQAINDFVLFSIAATGSLVGGYIYSIGGWLILIYVVSGLMALNLLLYVAVWVFDISTKGTDAPLSVDRRESKVDKASSRYNSSKASSKGSSRLGSIAFDSSIAGSRSVSRDTDHTLDFTSSPMNNNPAAFEVKNGQWVVGGIGDIGGQVGETGSRQLAQGRVGEEHNEYHAQTVAPRANLFNISPIQRKISTTSNASLNSDISDSILSSPDPRTQSRDRQDRRFFTDFITRFAATITSSDAGGSAGTSRTGSLDSMTDYSETGTGTMYRPDGMEEEDNYGSDEEDVFTRVRTLSAA